MNSRNELGVFRCAAQRRFAKPCLLAAVKTPLGNFIRSNAAGLSRTRLGFNTAAFTSPGNASIPNARHNGFNNRTACGDAANSATMSGCASTNRKYPPIPPASCAPTRHSHPNPHGQSRTRIPPATEAPRPSLPRARTAHRILHPAANLASIRSSRRPISPSRPYSNSATTFSNAPRPTQCPTARSKAPKTTGRLREGCAVRRSMMPWT
jgi:hypothetical protein